MQIDGGRESAGAGLEKDSSQHIVGLNSFSPFPSLLPLWQTSWTYGLAVEIDIPAAAAAADTPGDGYVCWRRVRLFERDVDGHVRSVADSQSLLLPLSAMWVVSPLNFWSRPGLRVHGIERARGRLAGWHGTPTTDRQTGRFVVLHNGFEFV